MSEDLILTGLNEQQLEAMNMTEEYVSVVKFDGMESLKPTSFDFKRMVKAKSE